MVVGTAAAVSSAAIAVVARIRGPLPPAIRRRVRLRSLCAAPRSRPGKGSETVSSMTSLWGWNQTSTTTRSAATDDADGEPDRPAGARSVRQRWVDHASQSRHRYRRYADGCRNVRETRDRRRRRRPTDPPTLWVVAPRVLVVDDEPLVREIVAGYLARDGMEVHEAEDGRAALAWLSSNRPDLVVLDVMLPEVDGLSVLRHLRQEGDIPVILLTARSEEIDRVVGLELGADDYVVKPFSPRELVARAKTVLRRTMRPAVNGHSVGRLDFGPLVVDVGSREVLLDGVAVQLTPKEFDLLLTLARSPRQVFSPPSCSMSCGRRRPTTRIRRRSRSTSVGSARSSRPMRRFPAGSPRSAASATGSSRDLRSCDVLGRFAVMSVGDVLRNEPLQVAASATAPVHRDPGARSPHPSVAPPGHVAAADRGDRGAGVAVVGRAVGCARGTVDAARRRGATCLPRRADRGCRLRGDARRVRRPPLGGRHPSAGSHGPQHRGGRSRRRGVASSAPTSSGTWPGRWTT